MYLGLAVAPVRLEIRTGCSALDEGGMGRGTGGPCGPLDTRSGNQ